MRRSLRLVGLALLALSVAWLWRVQTAALAAPAAPSVDGVLLDGDRRWVWTPSKVFLNQLKDSTSVELKTVAGSSLAGILGMEAAPANGDLPASVLLWSDSRVYRYLPATATASELLKPNLTPFAGIRGVTPVMATADVLIWTATNVYLLQGLTSVEVTSASGAALAGVKGAVQGPVGMLLWTGANVYRLRSGHRTEEILSAAGTSIAGVQSVVLAQAKTYLWTAAQAFVLANGLERAQELKAPDGGSLAGLKAILVSPSLFGDSDRILLWNAGHVYRKLPGALALQELLAPSGAPLAGVRGIVEPVPGLEAFKAGTLIWTAANVYRTFADASRTVALTTPSGSALADIRGAAVQRTYYADPATVFFWNSAALFRLNLTAANAVQEVRDAAGSPLAGVRGMDSVSDVFAWTPTRVYGLFGAKAYEVTRAGGASIGGAWGMLSGSLLRTDSAVFTLFSAHQAAEIKAPGGASIASSAFPALALVNNHHQNTIGVGSVNASAYSLDFVGSASAAADLGSGVPAGLSSVSVQGQAYQLVTSGALALNTSPQRSSMLLLGSPQPALWLPLIFR